MVNMGELFAHPRLCNVPMERVPLSKPETERFLLEEGDLLFARQSLVLEGAGKCSIFLRDDESVSFESHLTRVRLDQAKAHPAYYFYYFQSHHGRSAIRSIVEQGAGASGIRGRDLAALEVHWRPLRQQRAIAHVLGTLDDKIELNRRMNETLEEMARALFKSWFVDFDPVRAKMEGRWQRGQSLPGLLADLYDLFPDRLIPSELGDIPEGWEVKPLGECFNLTMGQSPPGSTYNDEGNGLPFFQGSTDFGFRYPERRRYCTAPTRIARPDDTLVSVRAPVGAINMAWERCCIGRGVAALRHKGSSSTYTYYAVSGMQQELEQYDHTGTVFGAITRKQFETLPMTEPESELVDSFESLTLSLDKHIRSNTAESRALAAQRDALLPKLVSGEVRMEDFRI